MKFTDGLWYDETRAVATAYGAKYEDPKLAEGVKADPTLAGKVPSASGIQYIERLVDNMCMQLVQKPEKSGRPSASRGEVYFLAGAGACAARGSELSRRQTAAMRCFMETNIGTSKAKERARPIKPDSLHKTTN